MNLPEPVGAVYTINGIRHCTLTQEPSETDLFTATQMREYRNAALEEAARVCDSKSREYLERNVRNQHSHGAGLGATICAEEIRALKGN